MNYLKITYNGGAWEQTNFNALITENSCEINSHDFDSFILAVAKNELDLSKILSAITKLNIEPKFDDLSSITCTFEYNGELLYRNFEIRFTPNYEGRKSKKRRKKSILNESEINSLKALDVSVMSARQKHVSRTI